MSEEQSGKYTDHTGTASPCMTCGACCAAYRVSFYWAEAEVRGLPVALTEKRNAWLCCMKGTSQAQPHCAALTGQVGGSVSCQCYDARPTPCREVQAGDDQCCRARELYQLPSLPGFANNC